MAFKTHDGAIHDRICLREGGDSYQTLTLVVVGTDGSTNDNVSLQVSHLGMSLSFLLTPNESRRLGELLIAASRVPNCVEGGPAERGQP
jgi:hypothetical protein